MDTQWNVNGTYFEACTCDSPCPCPFLGAPTEGSCTALVAWHVDDGMYGETRLDGLNAVLAAYSPGTMLDGNWKVALYVDERADEQQADAMQKIFSGAAGGLPGALQPLISEVLGVRKVPIDYRAEGRKRSLNIPGIAAVDIEALAGQGGREITIGNPAFAPVQGVELVAGKSESARFQDHGIGFDVSDKNGFYAPFSYQPD